MDNPDTAQDPIDKAYIDAEALLADDAARTQRRALVLGVVAAADAARRGAAPVLARRSTLRSGGWLAAAGVVGLSLFITVRAPQRPPIVAPAPRPAPAASAALADAAPAPTPDSTDRPPTSPKAAASTAPKVVAAPRPVVAPPRPEGPIAELGRGADAAADKAASPVGGAAPDDAIAAAAPVVAARAQALAAAPPPPPPNAPASAFRAPPNPAVRLRAAAAAGRTLEVEDLLANGTSVDAPDADGDTALMKSVAAGQVETAALLRRRGASLDRKNRAGRSVRDVAKTMDNPDMNQAIGVKPEP